MSNDLMRDWIVTPCPHPHASPVNGWDDWGKTEPPPADPRERALRAKQQRGTGPEVPDKERGLVTKYKEKP